MDFETNLQLPKRKGEWWAEINREVEMNIYTLLQTVNYQQGPILYHRGCYSIFCNKLHGKRVGKRTD